MSVLVENRKARFEYEIIEVIEAGISLVGTEVKSLRGHNASIIDGFITLRKDGPYLLNVNISKYDKSFTGVNHDPKRDRKLLFNKSEINKLFGKLSIKGFTIIPLNFHLKRGKIKLDIAVAKGKKAHDKRNAIKERDIERDMRRELAN